MLSADHSDLTGIHSTQAAATCAACCYVAVATQSFLSQLCHCCCTDYLIHVVTVMCMASGSLPPGQTACGWTAEP